MVSKEEIERALIVPRDYNKVYIIPYRMKEQFIEDTKWTRVHENPVQMEKWDKYLKDTSDYTVYADFSDTVVDTLNH